MSTILLAVLAVGGPPADAVYQQPITTVSANAKYESPLQLRTAWRDKVATALRQQATVAAGQQPAAVRKLVDLLTALQAEARLSRTEQRRLGAKLQRRLVRVGAQHPALFQQGGGFGAGGFGGQDNNSNALVDLIQQTIDPESWDINGGPGTIAIFRQ